MERSDSLPRLSELHKVLLQKIDDMLSDENPVTQNSPASHCLDGILLRLKLWGKDIGVEEGTLEVVQEDFPGIAAATRFRFNFLSQQLKDIERLFAREQEKGDWTLPSDEALHTTLDQLYMSAEALVEQVEPYQVCLAVSKRQGPMANIREEIQAIEASVIKEYGKVSAAMPKAQPYSTYPTSVPSPPSKIITSHVPLTYPMSSSKRKIIVGIDYGTTHSAISFVISNTSGMTKMDEFFLISHWPGSEWTSSKTPTILAYSAENNPAITDNQWGFQVRPNLRSYTWTKLLLDRHAQPTAFDDPLLRDLYDDGFLRSPKTKSAQDVVQDFLRELYIFTVSELEQKVPREVLQTISAEFWITIPAVWSDEARYATRNAARGAGFGSRPGDALFMIPEPEAAFLTFADSHGLGSIDPIQSGEIILICDCGGGTVDITTYEVNQTTPFISFDEIALGVGGKCGSSSIDRNFHQWMIKHFGTAYTSIPSQKRGSGSRFMKSFESAKYIFRGISDRKVFEIGPIDMELPNSPIYDKDELCVKLSQSDMKTLFDPSVEAILGLLNGQADLVQKRANKGLDRLVLVGGYCDSDYLGDELWEWCRTRGVNKIFCPARGQTAAVRGAVLRGLTSREPSKIIARRSYGWSWPMAFRDGIDNEEDKFVNIYDGMKMCSGRMHWVILKHQEIDPGTTVRREVAMTVDSTDSDRRSTLELYVCDSDTDPPPQCVSDPQVKKLGEIITNFNNVPTGLASKRSVATGRTVYQFHYTVDIQFYTREGTIQVKSTAYGKAVDAALKLPKRESDG